MRIDKVASIADIVLGVWLILTMFLWRSAPAHMLSAAVVGFASIAFGAIAYRGHGWARWLVAPIGVWLIVSCWVLPRGNVPIVINHFIVGTLLFGFSALPTGRGNAMGETPL